ncbi:hypothetical protein Aperf_G00000031830 [Anoplocephala perfoliata]
MVDLNNQTSLKKAIESGHRDCVNQRLSYCADLTLRDKRGNAPIHLAAKFGRIKIVELLLRNGVSINTRNQDGLTPLHIAIGREDLSLATYLLKEGAELDCTDGQGRTSLMIACKIGNANLTQLLINSGANLDLRDNTGLTAAEIAKSSHHILCYDLLSEQALNPEPSKSSEQKKYAERIQRRKNGLFTVKDVENVDGDGGGEDTGDDIFEGIFESSEEESDNSGNFSLASQGSHSNANTATKRSKSYSATNTEVGSSSIPTEREGRSGKNLTLVTEDDSWNSDSSEAKIEANKKKISLAAALSAKLAQQPLKEETEVTDFSLSNLPKECTKSWMCNSAPIEKIADDVLEEPSNVNDNWITDTLEEGKSNFTKAVAKFHPFRNTNSPKVISEGESNSVSENNKKSDVDSPWDSTEEEIKGSDHGIKMTSRNSPCSESSPWDSNAEECNVIKEAAEVSVSTLTQISETSELSMLQEFAKATMLLKREGALINTAKHVLPIVKEIPQIQEIPPVLHSDCKPSLRDVKSDRTFSFPSNKARKDLTKEQEEGLKPKEFESPKSDAIIPLSTLSCGSPTSSRNRIPVVDDRQRSKTLNQSPTRSRTAGCSPQSRTSRNRQRNQKPRSPLRSKSSITTSKDAKESLDIARFDEVESLHVQLVESLEALDREESTQRALEEELDGARQQLLTATAVYCEGSSQAAAHSSHDFAESLSNIEHLREKLDDEINQRRRLEAFYKSMKNQISEKDEELFRMHSICQDMDAELQRVRTHLKEVEVTKAQMEAKYEEDIRLLKEKNSRATLDMSTSPISDLQDDLKHARLLGINCDLQLLNEENVTKYEKELAAMQEKLNCLQNDAEERASDNQTARFEIEAHLARIRDLEEKSLCWRQSDELNHVGNELEESRKREKDASGWFAYLFNHVKSFEKSSHALYEHLNTVLHDDGLHPTHLALERDSEIKELINILNSIQCR